MQNDRNLRAFKDSGLNQLHEIGVVGIGPCALGNLEDHGSLLLFAGFGDSLHDLHVVNIEGTDGITALVCLFKHFLTCDQWHSSELLFSPDLLESLFSFYDFQPLFYQDSFCLSRVSWSFVEMNKGN